MPQHHGRNIQQVAEQYTGKAKMTEQNNGIIIRPLCPVKVPFPMKRSGLDDMLFGTDRTAACADGAAEKRGKNPALPFSIGFDMFLPILTLLTDKKS